MRKATQILAGLAVVASILPLHAARAAAPVQQVEGSVAVPMRYPPDPTYTTWFKPARDVYVNTGENGRLGYTFAVDPKGVGGSFVLEPLSGQTGEEDIDITWYSDLATGASTGASAERSTDGERGSIPSGTKFAIVGLFHGANAEFTFRAFAPVRTATAVAAPLPKTPGIYPNFGKGDSELATRLRNRSHVVIAVIDTGINPYHLAYRSPEYAVHPSEYITGFPKDVPALGLTFGTDYVKNRTADDTKVWSKVKEKKLYWIPGTNIVGAFSTRDYFSTDPITGDPVKPDGKNLPRPIIDDAGHGTGTTSVAGGAGYSPTRKEPFGSNPEALIVIVENLGEESVKWASEQPWIDFISGSYGDSAARPYNDTTETAAIDPILDEAGEKPSREYRYTAPFVLRDGRTACFSAGNGLSRTGIATDRYSSIRPTSGPSWVITVGAVSPRNGQDYGWHSWPVDISSYGLHWAAAAPFSTDGEQDFGGTSNATPVTCGVFSKALLAARRALGDTDEGVHTMLDGTKVPALGAPGKVGLIEDGVLTREELTDAVFKTAQPAAFDTLAYTYDPVVIPDSPYAYTQEGYGIANVASAKRAIDVVLGKMQMPERPEVDQWIATIDAFRNSIWAPPTYVKTPLPQNNKRPTQKKQTEVLGARLAATGVTDTAALLGVVLMSAAALVRRFTLRATN